MLPNKSLIKNHFYRSNIESKKRKSRKELPKKLSKAQMKADNSFM